MRPLSALLVSSCSVLELPVVSALTFVAPARAVLDLLVAGPLGPEWGGAPVFPLTLTCRPSWMHTPDPMPWRAQHQAARQRRDPRRAW